VLDGDQRGALVIYPLAPLHDHSASVQQLLQPEVAHLVASVQAVQVDVRQLNTAGIDADELERGTRNRRRRTAASCDPAHECGLTRSKLAFQQNEIALAQAPAQILTGSLGLGGR
jgi:hypothetical protein